MTTVAEKVGEAGGADKIPEKRRALGRGLDSLLPAGPRVVTTSAVAVMTPPAHGVVLPEVQAQAAWADAGVLQIALDQIDENPYQTRHFSTPDVADGDSVASTLHELAESIRANGVIQPVVVRPGEAGRFVLILGERRLRASKMAGKTTIPAIMRRVTDQQAAEMTVIENLQRQDLNCFEQANAFARLSKQFGLTQEQIGQRVGISRESVSNYMRLLKLPEQVLVYVQSGKLGFSEARVLLQVVDANLIPAIAEEAVRKHLSVEQLEKLVLATSLPAEEQPNQEHRARWIDPNVRAAQRELEQSLGCKVRIRDRKGKGRIVIEYASLEDYDRVLGMLKRKK